ncbi:hypothetical protein FC093_17215 [Ilyomonas limi]|uniref:Heavy metal binding domain-containing protein n=1 Tax=Ilyomonas limi TaxID=2575867 RepID=A0A4U3KXB7_9BACT|nr:heavy metal-binding domain-containing protein [Ilyomonas limi]TKK66324.1 hypothetical protein FC093_17215 [Ilyomonas limi]
MKKIFIVTVLLLSFVMVFTACSSNNNDNSNSTDQNALLTSDSAYTCTMHQDVISMHPGDCPKCGMHLVKQKLTPEQQKMIKEGTYVKLKE